LRIHGTQKLKKKMITIEKEMKKENYLDAFLENKRSGDLKAALKGLGDVKKGQIVDKDIYLQKQAKYFKLKADYDDGSGEFAYKYAEQMSTDNKKEEAIKYYFMAAAKGFETASLSEKISSLLNLQ
jgi:hypothetical protein